jgi:hypothetical protein
MGYLLEFAPRPSHTASLVALREQLREVPLPLESLALEEVPPQVELTYAANLGEARTALLELRARAERCGYELVDPRVGLPLRDELIERSLQRYAELRRLTGPLADPHDGSGAVATWRRDQRLPLSTLVGIAAALALAAGLALLLTR